MLATACSSGRDAAATPGPGDTVILGSGGGFSGVYTGYRIAGTGTVWGWEQRPASGDTTWPMLEFPSETTSTIFSELAATGFASVAFDRPGNLTSFVTLVTDTSRHTVRWGDLRTDPPVEVQRFYDSAVARIQRHSATNPH